MNINEIMSTSVKTCALDSNLQTVAGLMWNNDCGAIPVVDEKNIPLGIVTDRDIAMAAMLNNKPLSSLTAAELIKDQRLCCCQQNDTIENSLIKMEQYGVRRILVVNADLTLAGIVSMGDILAFTGKTDPQNKKSAVKLRPEPVLGMLKNVSGHHKSHNGPLTKLDSGQPSAT